MEVSDGKDLSCMLSEVPQGASLWRLGRYDPAREKGYIPVSGGENPRHLSHLLEINDRDEGMKPPNQFLGSG